MNIYTDEFLLKDVKQLHELIYSDSCFSSRDILRLEQEIKELENRGYCFNESLEEEII